MNRRDVSKLRTLQQEEPSRVSKMIRILWPEIRAAISRGHTLKVIRNRLEEIGISISYRQFVVYVGRLRREEASRPAGGTASLTENTRSTTHDVAADEETALPRNPLAKRSRPVNSQETGFQFRGRSTGQRQADRLRGSNERKGNKFIPLWNYILENSVGSLFREAGKRLCVHTVITGGQDWAIL